MNQLFVHATRGHIYLIAGLSVLLLPMSVFLLVSSAANGFKIVPLGLGFGLLAILAVTVFLFRRGHGRSARVFTDQGVALNSGQELAWSDLSRVVHKMAVKPGSQKRRLWRTEIQFRDGSSAWLIPSKVSNYEEVTAFVSGLQCDHVQEDA